MKTPGIYKITNLVNGKFYIGSSVDVPRRLREHQRDLKGKKHHSEKLQNSWNKYGESVFVFELVELVPVENLITKEQEYLDSFKPFLNVNPKAGNCLGRKFNEASKQKMSVSAKKRGLSDALLAQQKSEYPADRNGERFCKGCSRFLKLDLNFNGQARQCYKCQYKQIKPKRQQARKLARQKKQVFIIGIGVDVCYKFNGITEAETYLKQQIPKFNRQWLRHSIKENVSYHNFEWKKTNA